MSRKEQVTARSFQDFIPGWKQILENYPLELLVNIDQSITIFLETLYKILIYLIVEILNRAL
jgi:hypothetical protein